jgi:hypothetical protein
MHGGAAETRLHSGDHPAARSPGQDIKMTRAGGVYAKVGFPLSRE